MDRHGSGLRSFLPNSNRPCTPLKIEPMTYQARFQCSPSQSQRIARACAALRALSLIVLAILLIEWLAGLAFGQTNCGEPPQYHGFTPPGLVEEAARTETVRMELPGFASRPNAAPATSSGKVGALAVQPAATPSKEQASVVPSTPRQRENEFPNVVRLVAFDSSGQSFGSGSYIGNSGRYGLILSNWHVICDSEGLVHVHFANGFSSYGYIVRADKKWDLALIAISCPPQSVPPMPIAKTVPRPGDPLWIAGYGSGTYRMAGGQCVRYLAPDIPKDGSTPEYEIIELSATARQGDSGGPILNNRGELAGVLFGSDMIRNTAGSFCRRVELFLREAVPLMESLPDQPETHFASVEKGGPRVPLSQTATADQRQGLSGNRPERPMGDIAGSSSFGIRSGSRRYFSNAPGSTNVFDRMMSTPAANFQEKTEQTPAPSIKPSPQSYRTSQGSASGDGFVTTRGRTGERQNASRERAPLIVEPPASVISMAEIRQVGHQPTDERAGIAFASLPDPFNNGLAALNPVGNLPHRASEALASSMNPLATGSVLESNPADPTPKYGVRHPKGEVSTASNSPMAPTKSGGDLSSMIILSAFLVCCASLVYLAVKLLRNDRPATE